MMIDEPVKKMKEKNDKNFFLLFDWIEREKNKQCQ